MLLPYDPTIVLLGIYPKELKHIHTDLCRDVSTIIYNCQNLKQPYALSAGDIYR